VRTLTVWCPDWPLVAAGAAGVPAAIVTDGRVSVCSGPARAEGVRRGQRRREAQRRCSDLLMVDPDELRDARCFEPVVAALEEVCPKVELVRPGLCAFATRGPARYFGTEDALTGAVDAALRSACATSDWRVGVADGMFASLLAARTGTGVVVPPGGSAAFLAPFPIAAIELPELTDLLIRLGIRTLGAFAALPPSQVVSRFGPDGARVHRHARAVDERPPAPRIRPLELAVGTELDPPVAEVERVGFVAKALADDLLARLDRYDVSCSRVRVQVRTEHGEQYERVWRHDGTLTATELATRVRWQLAGWLDAPGKAGPTAGAVWLQLEPDELTAGAGRQLDLWTDRGSARRVAAVMARLQGMLGPEAIGTAVPAGGRGCSAALFVPWGEPRPAPYDGTPPWPGRLPAPTPATVHRVPLPALVVGADGEPVTVDDRDGCAPPARVRIDRGAWLDVVAWSGPWPVDEQWWDDARSRRSTRFQVSTADGTARLLSVSAGRWQVDADYD
jgi:protein ImuB